MTPLSDEDQSGSPARWTFTAFLLTIADSGERKSSCDGFFTKAIVAYQNEQADRAKPALDIYNSRLESWQAKKGGVKDQIRHLARKGKDTGEMEDILQELEKIKPVPPKIPRLIYCDSTPEALAYSIWKNWPSAGVISAEAGVVFGGHAMGTDSILRNLATLNTLWDGGSLTIDRRTSESFTLQGARLTMSLMIQKESIREFFAKSGDLARGTGFLARFLFSSPVSTQGSRLYIDPPATWPHLTEFERRLTEILNHTVRMKDDGTLTPVMLSLSPEAKKAWVKFHDVIEIEIGNGGELHDVHDVASKIADNAVRLAALFQIFDSGLSSDFIELETFESASRVAAWHLNESQRFFGELALPPELAHAAKLDDWLIAYCRRNKTYVVPMKQVQQCGPSGLRKIVAIEIALHSLAELGRARLAQNGRTKMIEVNPEIVGEGKA